MNQSRLALEFSDSWCQESHKYQNGGCNMKIWFWILKRLFLVYRMLFVPSVRISGLKNLIEGPSILVANHPNATDCCVFPYIFPDQLTFLIQADLFELPVIGTILRRSGQIPVHQGQGKFALEAAMTRLSEGGTVVIFPEGRLNHGKTLHRARSGAAVLAKRSGAPVVPVGIYVSPQDKLVINGKFHGRQTFAHWQVRGCCYVNIGKSWKVTDLALDDQTGLKYREISELMMEHIGNLVCDNQIIAQTEIRKNGIEDQITGVSQ